MADCTVGAQAMHEAVGEAQICKANCKTKKNFRRRKLLPLFCTSLYLFLHFVKEDLIEADIEATGLQNCLMQVLERTLVMSFISFLGVLFESFLYVSGGP